jgi:ATP-dependent exoDNAse (exonuclease V) alpha subunit
MGEQSTTSVSDNKLSVDMEHIPKPLQELPESPPKRAAKRVTFRTVEEIKSTLNTDQQKIFDLLMKHLDDPETLYFLMHGYAGTGKTYLTIAFVEAFLGTQNYGTIAVTATTNKAVKVLNEKADFHSNRVSYKTIHSLLGLKETVDDYGNVFFKASDINNPLSASLQFIIIDESSMINRELYDIIIERTEQVQMKTIFIGDFFQIPPVKETECRLCFPAEQRKIKLKSAMLTKIVRQAEGNPIIELATYIREHENEMNLQYDYREIVTPQGSLIPIDRQNKEQALKVIEHIITSDYFKQNADYGKVLAWRNDTVNKMNHVIRKMIYGEAAQSNLLMPGEKLIANKPIMDKMRGNDQILFTTNAEFEVLDIHIKEKQVDKDTFKYFSTRVAQYFYNSFTMRDEQRIETIHIIHPESQTRFGKLLQQLKERALARKGTTDAKFLWKLYFQTAEHFADVKYNYCLTTHKSQGSTFTNTIVLERDITANQTMPERNRILYVAVTRPSINLIIVR